MKDQYGNDVPSDLVLLPDISTLNGKGVRKVMKAKWYEVNDWLLVSAKAINFLSADDPADAGADLDGECYLVQDCLKRWSIQDGWYHA